MILREKSLKTSSTHSRRDGQTPLIKACNVSECPNGKVKGFTSDGRRLLVANINGTFYACSARCTHVGGPLDEGRLDGNIVTCPWHGSRFDVTDGKVIDGPAGMPIQTFKVQVKGNEVFVDA